MSKRLNELFRRQPPPKIEALPSTNPYRAEFVITFADGKISHVTKRLIMGWDEKYRRVGKLEHSSDNPQDDLGKIAKWLRNC